MYEEKLVPRNVSALGIIRGCGFSKKLDIKVNSRFLSRLQGCTYICHMEAW